LKLLLAGFNTRAFAESFVRAGFDVECVDCFSDFDHRMQCRVHPVSGKAGGTGNMADVAEKVLNLLDSGKYDYFCYTSGLENQPESLAEIEKKGVRLLGNPSGTVVKVRDIFSVSRMLRNRGFSVPEAVDVVKTTIVVNTATTCPGLADKHPGRRWLIKPLAGGGGRGIEFAPRSGRVPDGFFAQEHISGVTCSFAFVAAGGRCRLLGVSEQLIGTGVYNNRQFGYLGNILPPDLLQGYAGKMLGTLQSIAEWFSGTFGLVGLNGVDFVYDGERCWFIEINPRYTASMELMEIAGGASMAKLHFDACAGILPQENCFAAYTCRGLSSRNFQVFGVFGKKIVYTGEDVQVVYPQAADAAWVEKMRALGIRDMPHDRERIKKGSPVATVLASGENRNECVRGLEERTLLVKSFLIGE